MRDRDLQKIWEALELGIDLFRELIENGANDAFKKEQSKLYSAQRLIVKDRKRLAKRRETIEYNREANKQYKEDVADYDRNRM